jgi:Ca2+-binding RTX toxin-like protein
MAFTYNNGTVNTGTVTTTIARYNGGSATSDSLALTNYSVQLAALATGTGLTGDDLVLSSGNDLWLFDDNTATSGSRTTINGASRLGQSLGGTPTQTQAVDVFSAGDGNDVLSFGTASGAASSYDSINVTVFGEGGNDVVWAAGGNDTLFGGIGHDWLDGGAGNNVLWGGDGSDTVQTYGGNDYLSMAAAPMSATATSTCWRAVPATTGTTSAAATARTS